MVENNNKGNNSFSSFSFVEVATENIDMKREREEMLARKRKINPSNKQEENNTNSNTRFSENLTPSLDEFIPIGSDTIKSNEGTKIEPTRKVKTKGLNCEKKRNYVQVRISLTEQEQNILRLYLSSSNSNLSSLLTDLVLTKIKSIKKELTKEGINALLGLENKE